MTNTAALTDTFPTGLALVSLDAISASPTLSTSQPGGFAGVLSSAAVGGGGGSLSLNFGTITNGNRDTTQTQTIVVTYTAVALNVAGNTAGKVLSNSAVFAVQGGSTSGSAPVTVVEPHVGLTITPSATTGDAGGATLTFTLVVSAAPGTGADAYDTLLSDVIPSGYAYVSGSLTNTAGQAPTTLSDGGGTFGVGYSDLAPGATSTLRFQATLSGGTTPGQVVAEPASLTYTSLPGSVTSPQSTYNAGSTERTGETTDPGGAANTYAASASTSVTVNADSVAGVVFDDANDDGTKQSGEAALSGVTVALSGTDNLGNAVSLTTTTSASGAYGFTLLRPGTYAVAMTPPAGDLDGKDTVGTPFGGSNPSPDHFSGVAIPLGTNPAGAGYNFAELRPASVAGTVFSDLNDNGSVDSGEPGLAGVTVTLTGTDDLGNPVNTVATTDASGQFRFNNLRPGGYTVAETQPAGYLQGKNSAGNTGGSLSGDTLGGVTLTEGKADAGVTYGELAPASLAGAVYLDANDDGVKQPGEAGIGGAAVTLTGTDDVGNAVNLSTVTNPDGSFTFTGLRPSDASGYTIAATTPSGDLAGKGAAGTAGGTVSGGRVGAIVVNDGTSGTAYDFGVLIPAGLFGYVYVDANDDGSRAGDVGLPGVTVTLTGTDDNAQAVDTATTTGADGSYAFEPPPRHLRDHEDAPR